MEGHARGSAPERSVEVGPSACPRRRRGVTPIALAWWADSGPAFCTFCIVHGFAFGRETTEQAGPRGSVWPAQSCLSVFFELVVCLGSPPSGAGFLCVWGRAWVRLGRRPALAGSVWPALSCPSMFLGVGGRSMNVLCGGPRWRRSDVSLIVGPPLAVLAPKP
ncbi:MAG: hypothetical protein ACJAYU_000858 [Bradymonadia bacterium]|jgi:hypothetical protein